MIKSADIQGLQVTGIDGAKLGAVRELFVDLAAGRIDFLVVEAAGLLGGSGKFHPVPWFAVRYDIVSGRNEQGRLQGVTQLRPRPARQQQLWLGRAGHPLLHALGHFTRQERRRYTGHRLDSGGAAAGFAADPSNWRTYLAHPWARRP
jgi:sporulation protein YlmC with PRC-barrel domain